MKLDGIMIWVSDVPATVAFYQAAVGLELQMMNDDKQYAQLTTGDTTLVVRGRDRRQGQRSHGATQPARLRRPGCSARVRRHDVEAADQQAVAAGPTAEVPLTTEPSGRTLGYLRDINGFLVELSSTAAW